MYSKLGTDKLPSILYALVTGLLVVPVDAVAQGNEQSAPVTQLELSPPQMFVLADQAKADGQFELAASIYEALSEHPEQTLRNEARFRHAQMAEVNQGNLRKAAVLLRQILDETPNVARVRIELARLQAMLGEFASAQRELRAAQVIGLPPHIEREVRFLTSAIGARRRFGLNGELSFAPDTNINRATRSDTLNTVIGELDLSEDAQAQSGIGILASLGAFHKESIGETSVWLTQMRGGGRIYRDDQFNDFVVSIQSGPQFQVDDALVSVQAKASWRWFGNEPFTRSFGLAGEVRLPVAEGSQLRASSSVLDSRDFLNPLRSGNQFAGSVGFDSALSPETGVGGSLTISRTTARDPGYSAINLGASAYLFREFGQTTVLARVSYSRLEADRRLFLYPSRRVDNRFSTGATGIFRQHSIGLFAPLVRVNYEKNSSTVGIFEFERLTAEVGVTFAY